MTLKTKKYKWKAMREENEDIDCMKEKFTAKKKGNIKQVCPNTQHQAGSEKEKTFSNRQRDLKKNTIENTLSRKVIRTKDPEVRRQ